MIAVDKAILVLEDKSCCDCRFYSHSRGECEYFANGACLCADANFVAADALRLVADLRQRVSVEDVNSDDVIELLEQYGFLYAVVKDGIKSYEYNI